MDTEVKNGKVMKSSQRHRPRTKATKSRWLHLPDDASTAALVTPKKVDEGVVRETAARHRRIKRLIDVVVATAGIVLLLPFILLIAAAIKLSSRGPVFFAQQRIGLKGKMFTLLKFRTMVEGCRENAHRDYVIGLIRGESQPDGRKPVQKPMSKLTQDERITAVGKFLRTWSLDELPQLLNVLRGDMSLVGPRPAIPYEVENYHAWHMRRLDALPGITGLWQVNGRNTVTFDAMVRMDIYYVEHWSLKLDLKIVLLTFNAVLRRHGAA